jgi:hypothetical protein
MRLHISVVNKLLELVHNYGGHENDNKLRAKFTELDLTPYERQSTHNQEVILVLTEDYVRQLSGNAGR